MIDLDKLAQQAGRQAKAELLLVSERQERHAPRQF